MIFNDAPDGDWQPRTPRAWTIFAVAVIELAWVCAGALIVLTAALVMGG